MSANENTAENTTQDQPNLHSNISADQHVSRFTPTQRTTLHAAINAAVNKAFDAAVQRAMGPLVQQKTTMLMQLKDIIPQQLEKATFVPSKPPAEYSVPQPPTTPLVPPPSGPLLAHQRPVLYQNEGPIGQFRVKTLGDVNPGERDTCRCSKICVSATWPSIPLIPALCTPRSRQTWAREEIRAGNIAARWQKACLVSLPYRLWEL